MNRRRKRNICEFVAIYNENVLRWMVSDARERDVIEEWFREDANPLIDLLRDNGYGELLDSMLEAPI